MINSGSVSIAVSGEITSPQLKLFVEDQAALISSPADSDLLIKDSPAGIILYWRRGQQKELEFFIDIDKFCRQQKTFPAPKHAGLSQAIGRKTKHVIDATAGWGSDALLLCAQGYR
ncbi:MAG: class I SAM-dependent methyltransferase, partial [Arenicella sp.]|nr:class I SAM-dependent methyltransferase [Arenicella sp.]